MSDRAQVLTSLLRTNLSAFSRKVFATLEPGIVYQHNWHIDHLCWQLSRVERGEIKRLIINVPPRSMKSILVSNAFTAWYLGRDPTRRVICASYASSLAEELSLKTKRIFQTAWFERCFPDFVMVSERSTELSTTQLGSVGTVWGAKGLNYYLLDLVRGRWEFPELRRQVQQLAAHWQVNQTIIEDTETGRALAQDLRRTKVMAPLLQKSRLEKEARFAAQSARFESGQVYVPKETPWLAPWLAELIGFPNSGHDDQVDSTSQALQYLTRASHMSIEMPAREQRPEPIRPRGQSFRSKRSK